MPKISGANIVSKQSILLKIKTKTILLNFKNPRNVVLNARNVVSVFVQLFLKNF
jgi:hypothetical protein